MRSIALGLPIVLALPVAAVSLGGGGGVLPPPATDVDFYDDGAPLDAKVELGKVLFFDKILSGNKNISCATCHHPLADTGDGLSLPVGEGGVGLGVTRNTGDGVPERVPRNAPTLFNLGAKEFVNMFHDGRVAPDPTHPSGFLSPAGDDLPLGLDNVLAVQAMFPVTSGTEMAGQLGENRVARAAFAGVLAGPNGVWEILSERLRQIPEYVDLFKAAYPGVVLQAADINFVHAANAIAAFEAKTWRATNSPFDRLLAGDNTAMSKQAIDGAKLFYGSAGCATCHSGTFQTDQQFHAIAVPQIGPGKGDGPFGYEDFGLERTTLDPADRYKFRTPSLRNVAQTGPWGHDGAFNSLEDIVRHHLDAVSSLQAFDTDQCVLPSDPLLDPDDFLATNDPAVTAAIAAANELPVNPLSDAEVDLLLEFLRALTDPASIDLRGDVPPTVPSGIPVAE